MLAGQWTVSDMFFQHERDGAETVFGVALFAAVWFVRDRAWRRISYVPHDVLTDSVVSASQCPWVICYLPTRTQAERRAARLHPPPASEDAVLYRQDGGRRQGIPSWSRARWLSSAAGRPLAAPRACGRTSAHAPNSATR